MIFRNNVLLIKHNEFKQILKSYFSSIINKSKVPSWLAETRITEDRACPSQWAVQVHILRRFNPIRKAQVECTPLRVECTLLHPIHQLNSRGVYLCLVLSKGTWDQRSLLTLHLPTQQHPQRIPCLHLLLIMTLHHKQATKGESSGFARIFFLCYIHIRHK